MKDILNKRVISTPLDGEGGALGYKRLALVVAVILVLGAGIILGVRQYLLGQDSWTATVTSVGKGFIGFEHGEPGDDHEGHEHIALVPEGMELEVGDTVVIHTDIEEGNTVVEKK